MLFRSYTPVAGFNLLTNVTSSGKVFVCPSDSGKTPKATFNSGNALAGGASGNISYGYIAGGVAAGGAITWQDSPDSIIAFDRDIAGNALNSAWTAGSPHKTDGGNLVFNDGHVEFKTKLPSRVVDGNSTPAAATSTQWTP